MKKKKKKGKGMQNRGTSQDEARHIGGNNKDS